MRDRGVVALVVVAAFTALFPSPSAAREATAAEVRALAARAEDDPEAYESLLTVDSVDGRPVDLRAAFEDADADERAARLDALAGHGPPDLPTATRAREDARDILAGRDYDPPQVPRPFRGALRRLGDWVEPVLAPLEPVGRFLRTPPGLAVLVVAVGVLAWTVSARLLRRRAVGVAPARGGTGQRGHSGDPAVLEREADRAEADGDLDLALRLRFRAGLLRLDGRGLVPYRPSLRSGDLRRALPSPTLDSLAQSFDEVVYGGRPAGAADVAAAREGWPRVLEEGTRR